MDRNHRLHVGRVVLLTLSMLSLAVGVEPVAAQGLDPELSLGSATEQAAEEAPKPSFRLRLGMELGLFWAQMPDESGGGLAFALEGRLFAPDGWGVVARGHLELGSPNLFGGDVGVAYQTTVFDTGWFRVELGGAMGISVSRRFYVAAFGSAPGGSDHAVGGYFAELYAQVRLGRTYVGLAAVHRAIVVGQDDAPIVEISPRIVFGSQFDL